MIRVVLGLALLGLGATKVVEGFDESYRIGEGLFYAAAGFECLVGVLLFTRHVALAAVAATGLAFIGVTMAFVARTDPRSCGCFGSATPDDWRLQMAASGTLGLLSLIVWESHRVHD